MKKLILVAGIFFVFFPSAFAQKNGEPVFYSYPSCYLPVTASALGFSFYFHPDFIRTTLTPVKPLQFYNMKIMYANFEAIHYQLPEQAVFCRMENFTTKHYGVMFSIHAGAAR